MSATLGPKLPRDDRNGMHTIANSLLENPHHMHAVIMFVDCGKIVEDVDEDTRIPMARIRRIEPALPSDYKLVDQIMRRALSGRHGSSELPLDDEKDLFSFLNPEATLPANLQGPDHVTVSNVNDDPAEPDDPADDGDPFYDADKDAPEPHADDAVASSEPTPLGAVADELLSAREREDKRIAGVQGRRGRAKVSEANPFSSV